jgi:hypothetical protein
MIVRVATFQSLTGDEWLDNVKRRVGPATLQMRGNRSLQSVPLLPGQDPSKIPSPDGQEFYEVVYATADLVKRPITASE